MHPWLRHLVLVLAGLLFAGTAFGAGLIDPALTQRMNSVAGPYDVIVTFKNPGDASALSSLGVKFMTLEQLPMARARLTTAQIVAVRYWPSVESIYFNAPLQYSNYTSGEITGG